MMGVEARGGPLDEKAFVSEINIKTKIPADQTSCLPASANLGPSRAGQFAFEPEQASETEHGTLRRRG